MCSNKHISAIVNRFKTSELPFTIRGKTYRMNRKLDRVVVGARLFLSNYISLLAWYGEGARTMIGNGKDSEFNLKLTRKLSDIEVLKLIDCLDYQSCEKDTWEDSDDKALLEVFKIILKDAIDAKMEKIAEPALRVLKYNKEYDAAEWCI